jgi:hypothetical protein
MQGHYHIFNCLVYFAEAFYMAPGINLLAFYFVMCAVLLSEYAVLGANTLAIAGSVTAAANNLWIYIE